jgi:hypothetical protein
MRLPVLCNEARSLLDNTAIRVDAVGVGLLPARPVPEGRGIFTAYSTAGSLAILRSSSDRRETSRSSTEKASPASLRS